MATGSLQRALYRRVERLERGEGLESLFDSESAKRRVLSPAVRRFIVDLKAEHPLFNTNEISNIVYVRFGRRPDYRTVGRVLGRGALAPQDEYPTPKDWLERTHSELWGAEKAESLVS